MISLFERKAHLFLIFFSLLISQSLFAQLDGSNNGGKEKGTNTIGLFNTSAKEVKKPKSLDFKNNDGFKTAHNKQQKDQEKKQAERDLENKMKDQFSNNPTSGTFQSFCGPRCGRW